MRSPMGPGHRPGSLLISMVMRRGAEAPTIGSEAKMGRGRRVGGLCTYDESILFIITLHAERESRQWRFSAGALGPCGRKPLRTPLRLKDHKKLRHSTAGRAGPASAARTRRQSLG